MRQEGYCPRCNAKGRHRFLADVLRDTQPLPEPILHVGPSLAERRLMTGSKITMAAGGGGVDVKADIQCLPFDDGAFGSIVAVHVLEHVESDASALAEISRVLRTGGLAVLAVPTSGRATTDEDDSVVDPAERRERFGEPDHRRVYGTDLAERLERVGFRVALHLSREIPTHELERIGVRPDEMVVIGYRDDVESGGTMLVGGGG